MHCFEDKYDMYRTCESCGNTFERACLLESKSSNFYCTDCFKRKYCKVNTYDQPRKQINKKHRKVVADPEAYVTKAKLKPKSSSETIKTNSTASLSKRPLQCPQTSCNQFLSCCSLQSHFKYEHVVIPNVVTQFDVRNFLEVCLCDIKYDHTECIMLLNLSTSKRPSCSSTAFGYVKDIREIQSPKPTFVLLATRIASAQLIEESETKVDYSYEEDPLVLKPYDRIIFWLASNITTEYTYTVAVSTLNNDIRLKYNGPVVHINDKPVNLCQNACCLMMSHFHYKKMSENGLKTVAVDLLIHED